MTDEYRGFGHSDSDWALTVDCREETGCLLAVVQDCCLLCAESCFGLSPQGIGTLSTIGSTSGGHLTVLPFDIHRLDKQLDAFQYLSHTAAGK